MSKKIIFCVLPCLMLCMAFVAAGQAPAAAPAPKPENPQSLARIEAARKTAGNDPMLAYTFKAYCIPANIRANSASAPELEPVKIFDNLYAAGNSETTVYALNTSEGIIFFDAGYEDRTQSVLLPGLQKLGLDPANVKYILLGHGHADHFGGSKYFQDKYGTRVGTTAEDWDFMYPANPPANQNQRPDIRPKKDLVLKEGQPLRVGDVTVTTILTPGHTPGSVGFIFPVKDKGKTRMAGLFGGTIMLIDRPTPEVLKQYMASINHFAEAAKKMKVEVEVQNHPIFDGMPDKLAKLKTMKPGDPNPFVIGQDRYAKFFNIMTECIQAEMARRGAGTN